MKSQQIFFYAMKEDFSYLLELIESSFNIKYAESGLKDEKKYCINALFEDINHYTENLEYGNWNHNKSYLILPKEKELIIRDIPQRQGGIKYAIDQMKNKESIIISIGGKYKNNIIIASKISTISESNFSKEIFKFTSNLIKKTSTKIDGFYIFPHALNKLKEGFCLTADISEPCVTNPKTLLK